MKTRVRPRTLVSPLLTELLETKRREILIDPEGSFFEIKDLETALKKAAAGSVVLLPPGEYPAFELTKSLEICAVQAGTVFIKGQVQISASQAVLRGLSFQTEFHQAAIASDRGILVIDDCTVSGRLEIGGKTRLFVRNSLLGHANDAILLKDQSSAELLASRISKSRIGVAVRSGCSASLYHCVVDHSSSDDESNPGAGIFAEKAAVYCEAVHFTGNDVAVYLIGCEDSGLVACHLQSSRIAAVIASDSSAQLSTCLAGDQRNTICSQVMLSGGRWEILHSTFGSAPVPALTAEQAQIEVALSSFAAEGAAAIELRSCQLSADGIKCQATEAPALTATQCQGILQNSSLAGAPSLELIDSPALQLENCDSEAAETDSNSEESGDGPPSTIETIRERLGKSVGQEAARNELERLLRLALAERDRSGNQPSGELHFHSVFMGASGTGRLEAARQLAEGLHILGIVARPEITEVASLHEMGELPPETGVVFVRIRQAGGATGSAEMAPFLEKLVTQPGQVVILAGERDEVRRLLRSSAVLDRVFRRTLFFSTYGPAELASVFAQYCERDHIALGSEAARALLLAFHLYSERKDKRFANTTGVKALYESTRHRYLERTSIQEGEGPELKPSDLEIPADKAVRNAVERSPVFVTFCPDCKKENPWLPGLKQPFTCLHCETTYPAPWGVWKNSAIYRRLHDSLHHGPNLTPSARRVHLPSR